MKLYFVTVIECPFSQSTISIQNTPLKHTSMLYTVLRYQLPAQVTSQLALGKKKIGACLHRLIGATYFRLCSEVLLCLIRPIVLHLTDNQQPHRLTYTSTKYSGIKTAH